MVGCLVRRKSDKAVIEINGVDACDETITYFDSDAEGCLSLSFEQIDPIPITQEILERNGFSRDANGMNDEDDIYIEITYGEWQRNGGRIKYLGEGRHIMYVHELQLALRICGVKERIII